MSGITRALHSYLKLSNNPKRNVGGDIIIFILQLEKNVVHVNSPELTQIVNWQAKV